ncbi:hypothetical protein COE15_17530 [Bacillus cereus]|uniref:contact-dependent growth inhibition system immunity protein n=1 Tax=Bacillus sp. AFS023182 TaxID=2033492 RepID=UPI000BF82F06|nr:contact-dependent growth inhibition system immunity protein [Bacillus sp. AFS023182]PFE01124.1 hypothetical protein CN288_17885 [Bacillus sp. AFS023182]PGX97223.1 hypothetical protein COE15_17530 [Bacillus cereus]
MDVKKSLLKEIYNIEASFEINSKFDNWYKKLLNKTIQELSLDDVYTMLRQNILLKLAIEQACIFIREDPSAGVMYDGQLLEILSELAPEAINDKRNCLESLLPYTQLEISKHTWDDEFEKEEYQNIIEKFNKSLTELG